MNVEPRSQHGAFVPTNMETFTKNPYVWTWKNFQFSSWRLLLTSAEPSSARLGDLVPMFRLVLFSLKSSHLLYSNAKFGYK